MAKKYKNHLFAAIIETNGGIQLRSSWYSDEKRWKAYLKARRYTRIATGIVAIEEIGKGLVWTRDKGRVYSKN